MEAATRTTPVVAVRDAETAGAVIWWRLSGDVDLVKLHDEWVAAGLNPEALPNPPSPAKALRRAVQEQTEKRTLARPIESGDGWALVFERAKGSELQYHTEAVVSLDDAGALQCSGNPHMTAQIAQDFKRYSSTLTSSDISVWLIHRAAAWDAVALRDTGGIYFLPQPSVAKWRQVASALLAASPDSVLFELPALKTDEAVAAILDAVVREAEAAAAKIAEEAAGSDIGKRALLTRQKQCELLLTKLAAYEELLGKNLDTIKDRVTDVSAAVTTAVLAIEAEEK